MWTAQQNNQQTIAKKIIHQALHTSVKEIKLVPNSKNVGKYHHVICETSISNKSKQ